MAYRLILAMWKRFSSNGRHSKMRLNPYHFDFKGDPQALLDFFQRTIPPEEQEKLQRGA